MRKKQAGSNLVEYAIPLALIGAVVGIAIYAMTSNGALLGFIQGSGNMSVNEDNNKQLITEAADGSAFASTPDNPTGDPKINCYLTECRIDFGEFVIDGIPADFGEYVESHGNSGGTDKLVDILNKMIDELDKDDTISDADIALLRELANNGHGLGTFQSARESQANQLKQQQQTYMADPAYLIDMHIQAIRNNDKLEDFQTRLDEVNTTLDTSDVRIQFVNQIATQIKNLNERMLADVVSTMVDGDGTLYECTGDYEACLSHEQNVLQPGDVVPDEIINKLVSVLEPQHSYNTHVGSEVICGLGYGNDNGIQCN